MAPSLKSLILSYDGQVPRYTSYPTAPHFVPGLRDESYRDRLARIPDQSRIGLYLHVPFCEQMCWYCGCHTKITARYAPVEDYAHLLMREIAMLADALSTSVQIADIHFGGGSPTILRDRDFARIMGTIADHFTIRTDAAIAVEIDPRTLEDGHIRAFAACGVNRASMGVQDFDQTVMQSVNRPQPYDLVARCVDGLHQHGITRINMDLMYGLPHQTTAGMADTIDKVVNLSPDRVACFGYAHVPWMKKHMRLINADALPDPSLRYDLFTTVATKLEAAGYHGIGIDHFAREGDDLLAAARAGTLRRNFQGYVVEEPAALIGLGASAIGKLPDGYVQNTAALNLYQDAVIDGRFAVDRHYNMTPDDRLRAAVIERLMCNLEVDTAAICRAHNMPEDSLDQALEALTPMVREGLIARQGRRLTIWPDSRLLVRRVCAAFDSKLKMPHANQEANQDEAQTSPRHARAV